LLLPQYGISTAVNYRKELWESLGYTWEKLGYNGLAAICFQKSIDEQEDAQLLSRLGLNRLKVGNREAGMRDLALACSQGTLNPEAWEKWLRLLWQSGKIAAARQGLKVGRLLFENAKIPWPNLKYIQ
jgi:tetratricopeptide (TPR) repeat protein